MGSDSLLTTISASVAGRRPAARPTSLTNDSAMMTRRWKEEYLWVARTKTQEPGTRIISETNKYI